MFSLSRGQAQLNGTHYLMAVGEAWFLFFIYRTSFLFLLIILTIILTLIHVNRTVTEYYSERDLAILGSLTVIFYSGYITHNFNLLVENECTG